ncbi:MAG: metallophosphoesterase family protein [Gemmatimonadetes bacterium]|nr:metallophosphoesterase family protein [Gemmatimonadota bacterium]
MRYAVISDSHDNFYNLERTLEIITARGITRCFHLGDFCAPGFVRAMLARESFTWICVWGNVDGAKTKILLEQRNNPRFDISEEPFREIEVEGKKVFLSHFPLLARHAALTGEYAAAFYGDDHRKRVEVLKNGALLANPGELAGFATGQPSFGVWDPEHNTMELVDLRDFRVTR